MYPGFKVVCAGLLTVLTVLESKKAPGHSCGDYGTVWGYRHRQRILIWNLLAAEITASHRQASRLSITANSLPIFGSGILHTIDRTATP